MLGVWIGEAWTAAGRPADARLVELGPGRGVLMSDVLRVGRVAPGFLDAISVDLVETSPVLREAQARTLEQAPAPIKWRATFGEIPRAPLFILANESSTRCRRAISSGRRMARPSGRGALPTPR